MAATSPITVTQLDDILTRFYIPRMFEQLKVENPGYEFFKDMNSVGTWGPGNEAHFPVRQKAKRAVVGGTTGRLPTGGAATYATRTFNYPIYRTLINFLWDSKLRAGNERYIKNLIDQAVTDAKQEFLRRQNIYLYGGSFGYIPPGGGGQTIAGNAKTAGDVLSPFTSATVGNQCCVGICKDDAVGSEGDPLQVTLPWRIGTGAHHDNSEEGGLWLQPGDNIIIGHNNTYVARQVTSVTRDTYIGDGSSGAASVVLNATISLTGANTGAHIYLAAPADITAAEADLDATGTPTYELSDINAGSFGFANMLFDRDYLGARKASSQATPDDNYWDSVINHNSGTQRTVSNALIDRVILEMNQQFYVKPNLMIMNPGMWHEFLELNHFGSHAFRNQSDLPLAGHTPGANPKYVTAKATTGQGDLNVLVDHYCPHSRVIVCNTDDMGYATAHAMAEASEDGKFLRHDATAYDQWHGWMRWAGNFVSFSPSSVGVVQDLDQTIVAL